MPLLPEQPINVKSLIIETPIEQPKLRFDVKKEVPNEDWQAMINNRNTHRDSDWYAFTTLTASLHQIDPTKDLELTKQDWQAMMNKRNDCREKPDWYSFTYLTKSLHIIANDITYHPKKGMILKPPKQKEQGRVIPPLPMV